MQPPECVRCPMRGILIAIPFGLLCWAGIYGIYLVCKWVMG